MTPRKDCKACGLCQGRTQVVCPDGDPMSPIAFVGEAPGEKEDLEGRPFVGRSGKLLTKLLEEEGLSRDKVYITNTVKCRPPQNRVPKKEEMEACLPFLEEELENKRLIVTLGRTAAADLLKRNVSLSEEVNKLSKVMVRGKEHDLIVAYHPAASFYNPKVKDSLRETIRIARTYL